MVIQEKAGVTGISLLHCMLPRAWSHIAGALWRSESEHSGVYGPIMKLIKGVARAFYPPSTETHPSFFPETQILRAITLLSLCISGIIADYRNG